MQQVTGHLYQRYPLLARLRVAAKDSPDQTEALPLYLGLMLAAMESKSRAPCCFILPRKGNTAHLSALLFALNKFIEDYHGLDRKIAETKFIKDQKVFVRPPNKVYRYRGIHEANPLWIELGTLDGVGWQSFPLSDVRRLEVTNLNSPAGKLGQIPANARETPFDRLMEVNTAGNYAAFLNHVLLLDYQVDFENLVNNIHLQNVNILPDMPPLGELLPLGSLSQPDNGGSVRPKKWNFLNFRCDPLVAVTSSQEKLVAACKAAEPHSKVVIVNGLGLLASHLQTYDDVVESQRLVIIAEHDEQEQMQALADRGCKFWWLGQRDISMSVGNEAMIETTAKIFGPVLRSARNESRMEIQSEVCEDPLLNDIAIRLVTIDAAVKADVTGTARSIVSRTYKLLNDVASLFQTPTRDELHRLTDQLSTIRRELERDKHWIADAAIIMDICCLFDLALSGAHRLGQAKGDLLRNFFRKKREHPGEQSGILARNNGQVKQLENWSNRFGFAARVFTSSTLPEDASFDCIACVAWPGGDAFQRTAQRFLAPSITMIGYAFEINWLKQCHRKLRQRPQLPSLTQGEKSALMKDAKTVRIEWPDEPDQGGFETTLPAPSFSIFDFESRLRSVRKGGTVSPITTEEAIAAKYVGFRGDSYAYVTQAHRLPIVTDLLAAKEATRQKTPMKEIEQVRVGDFAVFRDGGNRDVIQVIADRQLQRTGQDAASLRKRANLWVEVLRDTGLRADQILAQMTEFGAGKTLLTIRNWLSDDSIIGPGLKTDLDTIARLAKSNELEEAKDAVWAAIKQIRGAHLSAGTWLTNVLLQKLPSCLGEIEESGTKINIEDVVTAWVVQVEDISPQFEQFPRSSVNRLLWERSDENAYLSLIK
jgi:hypothetical protein